MFRGLAAIALVLSCSLAACTQTPIDPDTIARPDDIPPGRGLLTGDQGDFSVDFEI